MYYIASRRSEEYGFKLLPKNRSSAKEKIPWSTDSKNDAENMYGSQLAVNRSRSNVILLQKVLRKDNYMIRKAPKNYKAEYYIAFRRSKKDNFGLLLENGSPWRTNSRKYADTIYRHQIKINRRHSNVLLLRRVPCIYIIEVTIL